MSQHPTNYCPVFGNYPKEYNRAVHGPYYPWVNYGPKDTPFHEVKLGEFKSWFARRQKTPAAFIAAASRMHDKYCVTWMHSRYGSPSVGILQTVVMTCFISLIGSYGYYRNERQHKYHW